MSDLPTATFPEACSCSTVPMAMFPEVCFWELSYVNVPTVNLKSCSMNVAPGTFFRRIFYFFPYKHYSYVLHVSAFGYD